MEPIQPRMQGGSYSVWVKDHERESEAKIYDFLHWRAMPRMAAQAFADDIADHGTHPELVGREFVVCVRDRLNASLTMFNIGWELEPTAYVAGEQIVETGRGGVRYA